MRGDEAIKLIVGGEGNNELKVVHLYQKSCHYQVVNKLETEGKMKGLISNENNGKSTLKIFLNIIGCYRMA